MHQPDAVRCLVGSTGFVGRNLVGQAKFEVEVHRPDIGRIFGRHFDVLVCAAAPAEKWRANRDPAADRDNLKTIVTALDRVSADLVVLISTVDVYFSPQGVDERTAIDDTNASAYGRNRLWLELECRRLFPNVLVIRLPGLFGPGLKKNFLFDLLHSGGGKLTHAESRFQFYDIRQLWRDLQTAATKGLTLVNLATPPMRARDVARNHFGVDFDNATEAPPAEYDVRTIHDSVFGGTGGYVCGPHEVRAQIDDWLCLERRREGRTDRKEGAPL